MPASALEMDFRGLVLSFSIQKISASSFQGYTIRFADFVTNLANIPVEVSAPPTDAPRNCGTYINVY